MSDETAFFLFLVLSLSLFAAAHTIYVEADRKGRTTGVAVAFGTVCFLGMFASAVYCLMRLIGWVL